MFDMATRKDATVIEGGEKCGECKKVVGKNERGVMCEQCELWFHCKCEKLMEDTYLLLNQDKIHFYCSRCDKAVGKLLKAVTTLQMRQDRMEEDMRCVMSELEEVKTEMAKVTSNTEAKQVIIEEDSFRQKWQTEMGKMKSDLESQVTSSVRHVKEDVEESLEIERRKCNLIIHGVPEADAEQDVEAVIEVFGQGLKLDFGRHVDKMLRIGRLVEAKSRPIRLMIKTLDGKKEILARAKQLKENDKFKRMFISPDLTRKQQEMDKELRNQLKKFREEGETEAKIRFGKVVKNGRGGREEVLYQPPNHH